MGNWQDCIVTLVDLIGVKKRINQERSRATSLMRQFHALIMKKMNEEMPSIEHAYAWNDSVLFLAYLRGGSRAKEAVLRDIDTLKREIDRLSDSYAIAVQGQSFPELPLLSLGQSQPDAKQRVTILRVSSYAMANCFAIENELGGRTRRPWYVDQRIAQQLSTRQKYQKRSMVFLPHKKKREVFIYEGYLW